MRTLRPITLDCLITTFGGLIRKPEVKEEGWGGQEVSLERLDDQKNIRREVFLEEICRK